MDANGVTAQLDEDRALAALLLTFPNLEAEHLHLLLNPLPASAWVNVELTWSFDQEFILKVRSKELQLGKRQLTLTLYDERWKALAVEVLEYKTKAEALVWLRDWLCTEMLMKRKCLTLHTVT